MSYYGQNYFNNFQVRNPVLRNPINRNPPNQVVKCRPHWINTTGTNQVITVHDVANQTIEVAPLSQTYNNFILPDADSLLRKLGAQSNGLNSPTYSPSCQSGDCIYLNVLNRTNFTGIIHAGGSASTGHVHVLGITGAGDLGHNQLVTIQFTNVSSGASGVTGAYIVY